MLHIAQNLQNPLKPKFPWYPQFIHQCRGLLQLLRLILIRLTPIFNRWRPPSISPSRQKGSVPGTYFFRAVPSNISKGTIVIRKYGISSRKRCSEKSFIFVCWDKNNTSRLFRELSKGFFSDSNQKLLSGNDNDIPIYEAKLSRDLRIVVCALLGIENMCWFSYSSTRLI